MIKKLGTVSIIFAVLGFIAIYLESEFGFQSGFLLGMGLLGIAAVIWGIQEILKREMIISASSRDNEITETFRGIVVAMSGLVLVLIGTALIASSILGLVGLGNFALNFIKSRPGSLLIFLGALGIAYSFQLMIGNPDSNHGFWRILASVPVRLFGLILFLIGLGLAFSGVFEVFMPDRFQQIYYSILQYFQLPQFL